MYPCQKPSEKRQIKVLRYIYDTVQEKGYPPTVREICKAGTFFHFNGSRSFGTFSQTRLSQKDPTKPRAMEITPEGLEAIGETPKKTKIPVIGTVTAGAPILAVEETTEYFPLPPEFESADDLFMLTIRGESMINAGILNSDQVIVRKQNYADNGDIVIAMTEDNEATCKRFFKESDHYRLQPENDTMAPIILDSVSIVGKVIGLYRNMIR